MSAATAGETARKIRRAAIRRGFGDTRYLLPYSIRRYPSALCPGIPDVRVAAAKYGIVPDKLRCTGGSYHAACHIKTTESTAQPKPARPRSSHAKMMNALAEGSAGA